MLNQEKNNGLFVVLTGNMRNWLTYDWILHVDEKVRLTFMGKHLFPKQLYHDEFNCQELLYQRLASGSKINPSCNWAISIWFGYSFWYINPDEQGNNFSKVIC